MIGHRAVSQLLIARCYFLILFLLLNVYFKITNYYFLIANYSVVTRSEHGFRGRATCRRLP